MRSPALVSLAAVLALPACGGTTQAERPTPVTIVAPPSVAASASVAAPPQEAKQAELPMHRVAFIYSLIDLWRTDDGQVELRLGVDSGGGTIGNYRYVPLVDAKPDFDRETSVLRFADTTSLGRKMLAGKRPDLLYHAVSGFRSGVSDGDYRQLQGNDWRGVQVPGAAGISISMSRWSKERVLEWRNPRPTIVEEIDLMSRLPVFRVVRGADKEAPSIPKALNKQLREEEFFYESLRVMPTGEVFVVGRRNMTGTLAALLWTTDPKSPLYAVSADEPVEPEAEIGILGGTTVDALRVQAGATVLRFDGAKLVRESAVAPGGLPDVWFGEPMVIEREDAAFARTSPKGPWLPIALDNPNEPRTFVVDGAGTIWKAEDQVLSASRKPAAPPYEVTEQALVTRRKASILGGGSWDATGKPADSYNPGTCRMRYVLLDDSPQASASADYPAHRAALKGHTELAAVKLVISRERDRQFLGGLTEDYDLATKLEAIVAQRVKASRHEVMCAEPTDARPFALDLATGNLAR